MMFMGKLQETCEKAARGGCGKVARVVAGNCGKFHGKCATDAGQAAGKLRGKWRKSCRGRCAEAAEKLNQIA